MRYRKTVCSLWVLLFAFLPLCVGAALGDLYGGWNVVFGGDDTGSCNIIISQASTTQATITGTCNSAELGRITSSGTISSTGSLTFSGGAFGVVFSGAVQGNSGSGTWSASDLDGAGTWTMTRVTTTPENGIAAPGFTAPPGIIPAASVTTQATGDIYRKTLSVDLKIDAIFAPGLAASDYNVYVIAFVPNERIGLPAGGGTFFVNARTAGWGALSDPLKAFLEGVAAGSQDQRVRIDILKDLDLSSLIGTEFYVGYGTSGDEMIRNRRYRGVFDVQP